MTHSDDFDAYAPLPTTIADCDAELIEVADRMNSIDVQFAFYNAEGNGDPSWPPRAIAAKTHMQRRHRALKAHKSALLLEHHAACAEKARAERAANLARTAELHANGVKKHRRMFTALQNWVWDRFPEHREEITEAVARIKLEGGQP